TRALVQDGLDARQPALAQALPEFVLVHVVGYLALDQIHELVALGQVIHRKDVRMAAAVQAAHQIAADESGRPCYHYHVSSPAVTTDVPSLPTTTPPARLAHLTASNHGRPAARVTARAARTVSPAPDTSNTSWACASMCWRPSSVNSVMPCSDLVTSRASSDSSPRRRCARSSSSASVCQRPTASVISARLGVMMVAPT